MSTLGYYNNYSSASALSDSTYKSYLLEKSRIDYGASLVNHIVSEQTDAIQQTISNATEKIEEASRLQNEVIKQSSSKIEQDIISASNNVQDVIKTTSRENIIAINELSAKVCVSAKELSGKLDSLNNRMDIVIEQNKLTNELLDNIVNLLKIPDFEKARQYHIIWGLKYFVGAKKEPTLFVDALEEFQKAEALHKQDFFILHRIGCIYLYYPELLDIERSIDYFLRAAKYASIDSDPESEILANVLTNAISTEYSSTVSNKNRIKLLVSDSFSKAAFAYYILKDYGNAVKYQTLALKNSSSLQNRFILSKYHIANGEISLAVQNLSQCIDSDASYLPLSLYEGEFVNNDKIIELLYSKVIYTNLELEKRLETKSGEDAERLYKILEEGSYIKKRAELKTYDS